MEARIYSLLKYVNRAELFSEILDSSFRKKWRKCGIKCKNLLPVIALDLISWRNSGFILAASMFKWIQVAHFETLKGFIIIIFFFKLILRVDKLNCIA